MPMKHYTCIGCGHIEEDFYHTSELIPPELPCPECDYNLEILSEDNFCQSKQLWGHNDPRANKG